MITNIDYNQICLSHLLNAKAGCDIGVQLSVRPSVSSFVRLSTVHIMVLFSAAVIAGSMKTCIVIVNGMLFKHAP